MSSSLALLGDVGGLELMVIALIALIMFGAKRLPELGRAAGRAIREFKRATSGVEENLREVLRDDPLANTLRPAPRQVSRGRTAATTPPASSTSSTVAPTSPATTDAGFTPSPSASIPPVDPGSSAPPAAEKPPIEKKPGAEDEIAG